MNELTPFTQSGRKGIAYDWQSLCDPETLAALQEFDWHVNDKLELVSTSSE